MKALKFATLILSILLLNGCGNDDDLDGLNPFYGHSVYLRFQDTSGNDLLRGIESTFPCEFGQRQTAKPEFYTLDVVFEDGIRNGWKPEPAPLIGGLPAYIPDERYPSVYFNLYSEYADEKYDYNSLYFSASSSKYDWDAKGETYWDAKFAEKITFMFTCPDLFGDDEVHEIVTWWELRGEGFHTKCTRITYDGKEFPVKDESGLPIATIILDK